ncbi:MAG: hemolysin family protein [Pseudomonadota bacterium]
MSIDVDPSRSSQHSGNGGHGWLASLKARLRLPGAQTLRDALEDALKTEAKTDDTFSAEERSMMLRLLKFGRLRVEDVMVPRADIIAVDETETLATLLATFEEAGVSRIPLYNETLDDLRGMVHIKDLMSWLLREATVESEEDEAEAGEESEPRANGQNGSAARKRRKLDLSRVDLSRPLSVAKIRRPVLYVPPSMPAMNLLLRMQTTRIHMAFVIDEYGGTDGLVTIEDLVEQIVGDIEDEHDEAEEAHISGDPKTGLIVSARTPVSELEEYLGVKLLQPEEEEEIDTLGGLVFALVGRVPTRGELIRHSSGIEFEVLDADPRRVNKLKVHVDRLATPARTDTAVTGH